VQSRTGLDGFRSLGSQISRQSVHEGGKVLSSVHQPPLPLTKYRQTPISTVYCGPKKIWKIKEITVREFQNACQVGMGHNMVKSSSPNSTST